MMNLLESMSIRAVPIEDIPSGTVSDNNVLLSSSVRSVSIEDIPGSSGIDDNTISKSVDLSIAGYVHDSGNWVAPEDMSYVIIRK